MYLWIILPIIVTIVSFIFHNLHNKLPFPNINQPTSWFIDSSIEYNYNSCDFDHISISQENAIFLTKYFGKLPVIVTDAMTNWSSYNNWSKEYFASTYGNISVKTGSQSSITYGGGRAEDSLLINQLLHIFETYHKSNSSISDNTETFTFDLDVIQRHPFLYSEYSIPSIFNSFDSKKSHSLNMAYPILSLGPSRSGLPFHTHGETWLAIINGAKLWYIYPPGISMPKSIEHEVNVMRSVSSWISDIMSRLQVLPKPLLEPEYYKRVSGLPSGEVGHQPFVCVQRRGEVMYLPRGWTHMTYNLGETIAIGGQAAWLAADRLDFFRKVSEFQPNDFESLKGLAIGLSHIAMDIDAERHRSLKVIDNIPVLYASNFKQLVLHIESDSWIILYLSFKQRLNDPALSQIIGLWRQFAYQYRNVISFGIINTDDELSLVKEHNIPVDAKWSVAVCNKNITLSVYENKSYTEYISACTLETHLTNSNVEIIREYVASSMRTSSQLTRRGSVNGVSHSSYILLDESIQYLKRAIDIRPSNPEVKGIYLEILSYGAYSTEIIAAVLEFEKLYDQLNGTDTSQKALSASYYALSYALIDILKSGRIDSMTSTLISEIALRLINKTLRLNSNNFLGLMDQAILNSQLGNKSYAIKVVRNAYTLFRNDAEKIQYIKSVEKFIQKQK